jgi:hypothetical protein
MHPPHERTTLVWCVTTPGISTFPSGSFTLSQTRHSCSGRGRGQDSVQGVSHRNDSPRRSRGLSHEGHEGHDDHEATTATRITIEDLVVFVIFVATDFVPLCGYVVRGQRRKTTIIMKPRRPRGSRS